MKLFAMRSLALTVLLGVVAIMSQSPFGESIAMAKRGAPKPVPPIKSGNIEYRVAHEHMGTVEAWDLAAKKMLWRKEIYTVKYDKRLETDVQDVFVTSISLKGTVLTVKNERGSEYELDLEALKVKLIKGKLVEEF